MAELKNFNKERNMKKSQLTTLIRYILTEAEEVKIYVQKGKTPPKGKQLKKGPRGGQYFIGTPGEKKEYEGNKSNSTSKKKVNIFNKNNWHPNNFDTYRKIEQWMPNDNDVRDEFAELLNTRRVKSLEKFINKHANQKILKKYLGGSSVEELANYMVKSKGYFMW